MTDPIPYVQQLTRWSSGATGRAEQLIAANDLQAGDGEGNSGDMEREQIADMVAASEARNETKLATAMGEVRTEFANLRSDIRELGAKTVGKTTLIVTAITLFFGIVGVVVSLLTFGSQWFGLGLDTSQAAQAGAERALAIYGAGSAKEPNDTGSATGTVRPSGAQPKR
jgi:hypothetical protein